VGEVHAVSVPHSAYEVLDDPPVPVVPAELAVPAGRLDIDDSVVDLDERDVQGAAAEVEDQDEGEGFSVQPIRDCGGRRLVDDAGDDESRLWPPGSVW
jgi:hypothetical protein